MLGLLMSLVLQVDPQLQESLEAGVTFPSTRVEVLAWRAPPCRGRYEAQPFSASGRVAVRVRGSGCDEWSWATIRLTVRAAVLTQAVKTGDLLDGAWNLREVELRRSLRPLFAIPPSATATRAMRPGDVLWAEAVRLGPAPGTPILVRVVAGGVTVEERGIAASCSGETQCATLPNGKRVFGRFDDGALVVSELGSAGGRL